MITDARDLPDGTELRADVCIVGSGPAGMSLALELDGSGLDVLVLEAGGFDFDEEAQDLYEMEMTGELFGPEGRPAPVSGTRLRQLGGTSGHWAGYCRPLRETDMEARPEMGRPAWPITHAEVSSFYDRALEHLGIGPNRFDHAFWDDEVDLGPVLVDDDVVRTEVIQISEARFGGSPYREVVEASSNVRVVLHANVTGIVPAESGRTVERLDVATLTGRSHTAVAGRYVVACGGLETARILLASARDRGGLGNERDLVGRGFCEHGQNILGLASLTVPAAELRAYDRTAFASPLGRGVDGRLYLQSALVLSDETIRREGLLGAEVQLFPLPADEEAPAVVSGPSMGDAEELLPAFDGAPPGARVPLTVIAEQTPHPDSRVTLTDELDALGMPRASLHWTISEDDRLSIVRTLEIMGARLGAAGVGRLQVTAGSLRPGDGSGWLSRFEVDPSMSDPAGFHLAHANHHCCTVPMSADPSTGVCDTDGRVWGFEDLYLAGSGVFTTAGVTSPTISIVALAVRLADHLRATA